MYIMCVKLCLFSALSRRVGVLHISIIIIIVIDGTQLPAIYPQHLLAIAFLQFSQHCRIEWPIRALSILRANCADGELLQTSPVFRCMAWPCTRDSSARLKELAAWFRCLSHSSRCCQTDLSCCGHRAPRLRGRFPVHSNIKANRVDRTVGETGGTLADGSVMGRSDYNAHVSCTVWETGRTLAMPPYWQIRLQCTRITQCVRNWESSCNGPLLTDQATMHTYHTVCEKLGELLQCPHIDRSGYNAHASL